MAIVGFSLVNIACSSVSSVSFGSVLATGCERTFGLMADGTVKEFHYVDITGIGGDKSKWGETFCT
jgi:hypothetical protein